MTCSCIGRIGRSFVDISAIFKILIAHVHAGVSLGEIITFSFMFLLSSLQYGVWNYCTICNYLMSLFVTGHKMIRNVACLAVFLFAKDQFFFSNSFSDFASASDVSLTTDLFISSEKFRKLSVAVVAKEGFNSDVLLRKVHPCFFQK